MSCFVLNGLKCITRGEGGHWLTRDGHIPGSLHQTEQSAGLEKGHHRHLAHGPLHWLHLPYLPGRRQLTARPTPVTLCTTPMEQAESDEQAEARPHPCGASALPQSAEHREEGDNGGRRGHLGKGAKGEVKEDKGGGENVRDWSNSADKSDRTVQKVREALQFLHSPNRPR